MRDKKYGFFALDPGSMSGVAYVDHPFTPKGSVAEIFKEHKPTVTQMACPINDNGTNELAGAVAIADLFFHLRDGPWAGADELVFVYEDFILQPGKNHNPDRSGLSPVRIMAHIQGYIQGFLEEHLITYVPQMPSMAKTTFTNERLKRFGLWTVGKEHGRDATRHLALAVRSMRA